MCTDLPVRKRLKAVVTREDGTTISADAFKEWLLRRDHTPPDSEAFLLRGLRKVDVSLGSNIAIEVWAPQLGRAHSSGVADQFQALGWTLAREFRVGDKDEPYEYLFEWHGDGQAIYPASRK